MLSGKGYTTITKAASGIPKVLGQVVVAVVGQDPDGLEEDLALRDDVSRWVVVADHGADKQWVLQRHCVRSLSQLAATRL